MGLRGVRLGNGELVSPLSVTWRPGGPRDCEQQLCFKLGLSRQSVGCSVIWLFCTSVIALVTIRS